MTVLADLFTLILVALVLITICLFVIVGLMIRQDREKVKLKTTTGFTTKKEARKRCSYFFGFLAEHPRNEPIPDECFGCTIAIDCIKAQKRMDQNLEKDNTEVKKPLSPPTRMSSKMN